MADKPTESMFTWVKFVVGVIMFSGMLLIHVYVKPIPVYLLAVPGILMGIDPTKFIGNGKK